MMTIYSDVSSPPPATGVPREPDGAAPAGVPRREEASIGRVVAALLAKEVRELVVWGVLGCVAFGAMLAYTLMLDHQAGYSTDMIAISRGLRSVLVMVPAIMGAVLGFVQFIFEMRGDRYALLAHRPAGRGVIWGCKVAAGLGMFVVAMGVPLWLAMAWVSDPRHMPMPFSWAMAWSAFADVMGAVPFYFAAMLVAQRSSARWWASRLVPMAAAGASVMFGMGLPGIGYQVDVVMVAAGVMGISGWAHFRSAGEYVPQPVLAKGMLLLTLVVAWCAVEMASMEVAQQFVPFRSGTYEQWSPAFLKDGTPVVAHSKYEGNSGFAEVQDLSGKVLYTYTADNTGSAGERLLEMHGLMHPENRDFTENPHEGSHYFVIAGGWASGVQWFMPASRDYLVAYDNVKRDLVGALGADGFEPGVRVPAKRFGAPLNVTGAYGDKRVARVLAYGVVRDPEKARQAFFLITAGDSLYRLSEDMSFVRVYSDPEHRVITGQGMLQDVPGAPVTGLPVVQTEGAVTILSGADDARPVARVPLNGNGSVEIGYVAVKDAFLVKSTVRDWKTHIWQSRARSARRDGTLEQEIDVAGYIGVGAQAPQVFRDYVGPLLAPPVLVTANIAPIVALGSQSAREYLMAWLPGRLCWAFGGSTVIAVAAFFWGWVRRGVMAGVVWGIVSLLAGIPGALAMMGLVWAGKWAITGKTNRNGTEIFA